MSRPSPPSPLPPIDPAVDISQNHYWRYHSLEALLACKRPITASQDEDLFIAVHQVCELNFHQMLIDLDRTLDALREATRAPADGVLGSTEEVCYFLVRPVKLYEVVNRTVPVLMTMRAFAEFRQSIGPSSGFQSLQFRRLEIMSGVRHPYWAGGTSDRQGNPHVAELEFNRRFGAQVTAWFERYRDHSLRAYFEQLCERAPGKSREQRLQALELHPQAGPLLRLLRMYEGAQLAFHRIHRQLAMQQLERVGVDYGTGGTSFREYLARYESAQVPLFEGLPRES